MGRVLRIVIVLATALAAGGATSQATASDSGGSHVQRARSTTTAPTELFGFIGGAPDPSRCESVTGQCLLPYYGHDGLTGAMTGTLDGAGSLSINLATGAGRAVSLSRFRGLVTSCPSEGTALLQFTARLGVRPGVNVGTFEVIQGSGTGGLAGLTGSGSFVAHVQPDQSTLADLVLKVRCHR